MYFELLDMTYQAAQLVIRVANLVEGQPDGLIGLPLIISDESEIYKIEFSNIAEFRSTSEPCFSEEGEEKEITNFLSESIGSEYAKTVCVCGVGAREPARHFFVYTESVVIEVLANEEPVIHREPPNKSPKPDALRAPLG